MGDPQPLAAAIAFALVYFTFFLDNVLLTVLVPIIPDWVRGEALALWARGDAGAPLVAPLVALLNDTLRRAADDAPGVGASQVVVGAVLGAKAGTQLVCAPLASAAVREAGAAPVLRASTALLALAALALAACSSVRGGGAWCAWCAAGARGAQGAGAAGAAVAGLALVAAATGPAQRQRALAALLGAVALGVLVGYPFGGMANALWSRATPFLMIALALVADIALQSIFLDKEEYKKCTRRVGRPGGGGWAAAGARGVRGVWGARRGAGGACAAAVLLTTAVMATLEPCLPLWVRDKYHPQWQTGAVFVPDSAGYLAGTAAGGAAARVWGAERLAVAAQLALGLAALAIPLAPTVSWLALPHLWLGLGLGAVDAALVPALAQRRPRSLPRVCALLQAAASAAYTLGPVVGGLSAWWVGFESTVRALGVLNVLHAAYLYRVLSRHPLSPQLTHSTFTMSCTKPMGPGPGAYRLPTTVGFNQHDPSRLRNPMFSFGTNAGFRVKGLGPGPAYRIDRVTRDGLVSSPAWSFGARFGPRATLRTPGPGAHAPERCPAMRSPRAPQYSMGARLGFGLKRGGPAPNAYALRLGPGSPAYTMGARVGFNLKSKSPGPAVYFQRDANVYMFKNPQYSLGARLEGAGKPTRTPGPANYPPNLYNTKKNPYSYSFGTKHGLYACPMIVTEDTMDCL